MKISKLLICATVFLAGCAARKPITRDLHPVPYCEHGRCECPPNYAYNEFEQKCDLKEPR